MEAISADHTMIVKTHLVCVRGLEGATSPHQHERDQLHRKLQQAVFQLQQQQQQQQEAGSVDDPQEALRQIS